MILNTECILKHLQPKNKKNHRNYSLRLYQALYVLNQDFKELDKVWKTFQQINQKIEERVNEKKNKNQLLKILNFIKSNCFDSEKEIFKNTETKEKQLNQIKIIIEARLQETFNKNIDQIMEEVENRLQNIEI